MSGMFAVTTRGSGSPDYTSEVSSGLVKPGEVLKINQISVMLGYLATDLVAHPYPVPWVKPLIGIGGSAHVIDLATGIATPYAVPAGYTLTMVEKSWGLNQDAEVWLYFDGLLVTNPVMAVGGHLMHVSQIVSYSTTFFDPLALSAHLVDFVIINRGGGDMRGGVEFVGRLEAVGTPPFPEEKTTQCPFCNYQQVVPVSETQVTCAKCTNKYVLYDTRNIGRLK